MPSAAQLMSKASKAASASPLSGTAPRYGLAMRFKVKVGELVDLGEWSACKGLKVELKVDKVKTVGGDYSTEQIFPDRVSYSNITLERAVHPDESPRVKQWLEDTVRQWMNYDGSGTPYAGGMATITLLGVQGTEVMHWDLRDVYPVSWSGPSLSATDNKVAIETLELAHRGFLDPSAKGSI
jgi:phage tail-like protein